MYTELQLVRPSLEFSDQIMDYRSAMLANGDFLDGCAGLEDVSTCEEWLDFEGRLKSRYGEGYVPSEVFLAVRRSDHRLVGIIDFRHPLTDFLLCFGGNIGYSVLPSERRKGYAKQMLSLMCDICRGLGEKRVLLCCEKDNEASRRTIEACGGILENEVENTPGLGNGGMIRRYWIEL